MNRLLLILACIPVYVRAATDTIPAADTSALQELYGVISQKRTGSTEGFRWEHRRILYKAFGIVPGLNNDSAAAARLRFGWRQLQAVRISGTSEPPFYFSQVLRLALHHGYGPLLLDAARWKVDLSEFDPVSHTSLLDYLEEEYRNGSDEKRLEWLREYKQVLLAHGAAYFAETNFRMQSLAKRYDKIRPPIDGLYPVQKNGKWGWVDEHNRVVVPLKYRAVRNFTGDFFEVSDGGGRFRVIKRMQ